MEDSEVDALAGLLSRTFIARRDVKAIQTRTGAYMPVLEDPRDPESPRVPWKMIDLREHVRGKKTYGHYLLSAENRCKVLCFDIDLEAKVQAEGDRPVKWSIINPVTGEELERTGDARAAWKYPQETWFWCGRCKRGWYMDYQESNCRCDDEGEPHEDDVFWEGNPDCRALTALLCETAFKLAERTRKLLEIPVAVAFSGNKGLHVYGLTGEELATDVRGAADLVLESFQGDYVPSRGTNFYRSVDPYFDSLSIEVFPKQTTLEKKDLGNLLRLPLGVNQKSALAGKRGFFLKYGPFGTMAEADPTQAITLGDPWSLS